MTAMLMSLPRENTHQLEKMRISRLGKIRHVFRHLSLVEQTLFHFSFHLCNLHFLLCVFHDRENRSSSRSWSWVRNLTFLNAYSKNPISFSIFQIAVGLYGSIYQPFAHSHTFERKKDVRSLVDYVQGSCEKEWLISTQVLPQRPLEPRAFMHHQKPEDLEIFSLSCWLSFDLQCYLIRETFGQSITVDHLIFW